MVHISGIFGLQGEGKTMLQTILGTRENKKYDRQIASNYHLKKIDYIPVDTLEDLQKLRNVTFLGDELWLWVFARSSMSKINQEISKIIMLNRKRNVNIIYTSQLHRQVDVLLWDTTQYFYYPHMIEINGDKYLYFHVENLYGQKIGERMIKKPASYWGKHYDTYQEIGKLGEKKKTETYLEKGIQLEIEFMKAIKKLKPKYVDRVPNSGTNSSWMFDILVYNNRKTFAIDVKSTMQSNNTVALNKPAFQYKDSVYNAFYHNAEPYLAFSDIKYKRKTDPKNWYLYKLGYNSKLLRYKANQISYNTLKKDSIPLSQLLNS